MVEGLIGKKIGMTQLYQEDGTAVPVTVLKAGPCVVVQVRDKKRDGYQAVQLGLVEDKRVKNVTKPTKGHFDKAGVPPMRILREFTFSGDAGQIKPGDKILVGDLLKENDLVDVTGTSKGRGFAGVVKRHGFRGGAATHGSMFHRAPGSIGASSFPSRVLKGMRAAGHMGMARVTAKNLKVVRIDAENNLVAVKGAVPGPNGGYVLIRKKEPGARS